MANSNPTPEPNRKLRWYQFHLWHLFIFVTICAIPCSWFACRMAAANRQKEAVAAIEVLGGEVKYDYEFDTNGKWIPNAEPPGPAWFHNFVGLDFLADVVQASVDDYTWGGPESITDDFLKQRISKLTGLRFLGIRGARVTDTGLNHLQGLTELEVIDLSHTQITDRGLEYLKGLANLEVLSLCHTEVSDTGLEHLRGMTQLEELYLYRTQVTDEGIQNLQKALPNCKIYHDVDSFTR